MKKILVSILGLALCIFFTLSGCTKSEEHITDNQSTQPTAGGVEESTRPIGKQESSLDAPSERTEDTKMPTISNNSVKPDRVSPNNTQAVDEIISVGKTKTINGYTFGPDGSNDPVTITMGVSSIIKGNEAYRMLLENNPDIKAPKNGMEYIIMSICVSYDKGEPESLSLAESHASLDSAKLYFNLLNNKSNAEQLTNTLTDNVYNLKIPRGQKMEGKVAFLHKVGDMGPLVFIGFNNIIKFSIAV